MADVNFSVDVILNMVNKGMNKQLDDVNSKTKNITKSTKLLGKALTNNAILGNKQLGSEPTKIIDEQIKQTQVLSKESQSYWSLRGKANQEAYQETIKQAKLQESLNMPSKNSISKFYQGVKANTPAVKKLTDYNKDLTKSLEEVSGIKGIDSKDIVPIPDEATLVGATKQMQQYVQNLEMIDKAYGKGSKESKAYFKTIQKESGESAKSINKMRKNLAGFNFDFLSLIFGGMALKKIFGGAFKTLKEGYLEIEDETSLFKKKTENLGDSFTLLKFTIFDAFANNPIIQNLIDGLTWSLTGLANFFESHPAWAIGLTTLLGFLGAVGTTMFAVGTMKQLFMAGGSFDAMTRSLNNFAKVNGMKVVGNADSVEQAAAKLSKAQKAMLGLAGVIAVGVGVKISYDMLTNDSTADTRLKSLFGIITSLTAAGAAFGSILPGVGTVVGAAVGLTIGTIAGLVTTTVDFIYEDKPTKQDFATAIKGVFSNWKNYGYLTFGPTGLVILTTKILFRAQSTVDKKQSDLFATEEFRQKATEDEAEWKAITQEVIDKYSGMTADAKKELDRRFADFAKQKDVGSGQTLASVFGISTLINSSKNLSNARASFENYVNTITTYAQQSQQDINSNFDAISNQTINNNPLTELVDNMSIPEVVNGINDLNNIDVTQFTNNLNSLKVPLKDFLLSFTGQGGLIIAISNLLKTTQSYAEYIPTLTGGLMTEEKYVVNLTREYIALANAKERAGSASAGGINYFGSSIGGGYSTAGGVSD